MEEDPEDIDFMVPNYCANGKAIFLNYISSTDPRVCATALVTRATFKMSDKWAVNIQADLEKKFERDTMVQWITILR